MTTATSTSSAASARVSYDSVAGLKRFAEVEGDSRVMTSSSTAQANERDSSGRLCQGGLKFRILAAVDRRSFGSAYAARDYVDPRLNRLEGLLVASSLTWTRRR